MLVEIYSDEDSPKYLDTCHPDITARTTVIIMKYINNIEDSPTFALNHTG